VIVKAKEYLSAWMDVPAKKPFPQETPGAVFAFFFGAAMPAEKIFPFAGAKFLHTGTRSSRKAGPRA